MKVAGIESWCDDPEKRATNKDKHVGVLIRTDTKNVREQLKRLMDEGYSLYLRPRTYTIEESRQAQIRLQEIVGTK